MRHGWTHLFLYTTLRTTSEHPQHHIHHLSSPRQASVTSPQSSAPAPKVPALTFQRNVNSSTRGRTHPLDEDLEHRSTICHVAAEARAARVRIARQLLRLREVDAVVAHGETRAIKVGRRRAADVHHHAPRVAIRAMHDFVLVEKTQTLKCCSSAWLAR